MYAGLAIVVSFFALHTFAGLLVEWIGAHPEWVEGTAEDLALRDFFQGPAATLDAIRADSGKRVVHLRLVPRDGDTGLMYVPVCVAQCAGGRTTTGFTPSTPRRTALFLLAVGAITFETIRLRINSAIFTYLLSDMSSTNYRATPANKTTEARLR